MSPTATLRSYSWQALIVAAIFAAIIGSMLSTYGCTPDHLLLALASACFGFCLGRALDLGIARPAVWLLHRAQRWWWSRGS
jgi:hypothetical protein